MTQNTTHRVVFVIGVSGCGKTTVGKRLAERSGDTFADADDFHSASNRKKMEAKIPLTDEDRRPWLAKLHSFVLEKLEQSSLVVACSALKQAYRDQLSEAIESRCDWILLDGNFDLIQSRMANREHFMPKELLQSQFDALEIPDNAIRIGIEQPIEIIVEQIDHGLTERSWLAD